MNQFVFYAVPLLSLGIAIVIGFFAYQRRQIVGAQAFGLVLLLEGLLTFGYFLEILNPTLPGKIFWDNFQWISTVFIPLAILNFALIYTNRKFAYPFRTWFLLAIIPICTVILVYTNQLHGLAIHSIELIPGNFVPEYTYKFGDGLIIGALFSFGISLWSLAILVMAAYHRVGILRIRLWFIIGGILLPIIGEVFSAAGIYIAPQRDATPYFFIGTNLLIAIGLFRYHLFDLMPYAREMVMDNMEDGVIVVDEESRVLDINRAAKKILNINTFTKFGQPVSALFPELLQGIDLDNLSGQFEKEVVHGIKSKRKYVELRVSQLINPSGEHVGKLILLSDISDRKQAELLLKDSFTELEKRVVERTASLSDTVAQLEEEITQRQEIEKEMRLSEEKFRTVIEQSEEAYILVDSTGAIFETNPAHEKLTGLTRKHLLGKYFWDVLIDVTPGRGNKKTQKERIKKLTLDALNSGESPIFGRIIEGKILRPDGTIRNVQRSFYLVKAEEENRIGSVLRDVTEIKEAQEKAVNNARHLTEINKLAVEVAGITSESLVYKLISEKIREITGAVAVTYSSYIPEENCLQIEYIAGINQVVKWAQRTLPMQINKLKMPLTNEMDKMIRKEFIGRRSSLHEMSFGAIPENLGKIIEKRLKINGTVGIALSSGEDLLGAIGIILSVESETPSPDLLAAFSYVITEVIKRNRAEKALVSSEEKYRSIIEQASEGIILVDKKGLVLELNQTIARLFDIDVDRVIGMPITEIARNVTFMDDSESNSIKQLIYGYLTMEPSSFNGQPLINRMEFLTQDGSKKIIQYNTFPVTINDENCLAAVVSDVTAQQERENELEVIALLSSALREAATHREMYTIIVEQTITLLKADAAEIEIIDNSSGDAVIEVARGYWESLAGTFQKEGTGLNNIIRQTQRPYYTNDLQKEDSCFYHVESRAGINGCIGVPLLAQEKLLGFLWIGRKTFVIESDIRLLTSVADIAANAIHRATLHEQTRHDAAELAKAYETTLEGWANALEMREQETAGHSHRVVSLTMQLAKIMGLSHEDLEHIQRGALLHDIGKMGIPDEILLKKGPLSDEEWKIMRKHPEFAFDLLVKIPFLQPALDIPLYHHERWDGTGYPKGLQGEEIPLTARIFSIIDVWDALSSVRPYRQAWQREQILEYLLNQAGKQFDPQIVPIFLNMIQNESHWLSTGQLVITAD